ATSRADALMHALVDKTDTEITVHVSAETLADFDTDGLCHLHGGSNLVPHTVRRLDCDAGIVRIIDGANGLPLDVGRGAPAGPAGGARSFRRGPRRGHPGGARSFKAPPERPTA
ncbi:MAG: hypothetical protein ACI8W7_003499, partial [Gammaproteobacteria bacterium]